MLELLDRLREASLAQDAGGLAALYAEDGVHEFPFVTPGAPTSISGRAAIEEFNATVYRALPFAYREYRTIAVHQVGETTLVVEQEALGSNTVTGAQFVLPNVWVIETDAQGLISKLRDYVNPVAVTEALGEVAGAFDGEVSGR
jgi:ketosteroid isomerase-like protein